MFQVSNCVIFKNYIMHIFLNTEIQTPFLFRIPNSEFRIRRRVHMISQGEVIKILSEAITTVILSAAPMLIVAMVVGLIVSIFQATTQINEQTLAFVPKIVCVMLALLIFGSYIFSNVGGFVTRLFESINDITVS